MCKDLLAVLWDLGRAIVPWGVCFVCVVGRCKCIRCIVCVTAHPDIVALLGTFSRAGLTWGISLSTWESPWKRAPKVTLGRFSPRAGRGRPTGGTQMSMGGIKVARGWDAGGTLSHPAHFLEASFRQRQEALCKPPPCLTLLN